MPERSGYKTAGGWASGNEQINGNTVAQTLTVDERYLNTPAEYKASRWVEITDGFESSSTDEFVAYIADGNNTPAGNPPGSGGENNSYRYGFNGKENDDEVKGLGDEQDYGMRVYDSRLGKFLSIDPIAHNYPMLTPYQFASNRPLDGIDQDGKEWSNSTVTYSGNGWKTVSYTVKIKVPNDDNTFSAAYYANYLSSIKTGAENIYSKIDVTNKTSYSLNIVFDYVPTADIKASDFSLSLQAVTSNNGSAELGHVASVGNTKANKIYLTAKIDGKDVNPGSRNLAHELGHTAGLRHPYDGLADPDLKNKYAAGQATTNLMTQDDHCNNNCGGDLTVNQMDILNKSVHVVTTTEAPQVVIKSEWVWHSTSSRYSDHTKMAPQAQPQFTFGAASYSPNAQTPVIR